MIRLAARAVLALIFGGTLLLPSASNVQAASWHSGQGFGLWTIQRICRNGVQVDRVYVGTDDPDEWEDFTDIPKSFSANRTLISNAEDEPQKIPVGDPIPIGRNLGTITVTMYLEQTPYHWVNDETQTEGDAWVYGTDEIRWPPLRTGVSVVVRRVGVQAAFIGRVTDCVLLSPQISLPLLLR